METEIKLFRKKEITNNNKIIKHQRPKIITLNRFNRMPLTEISFKIRFKNK